MEGKKRGKKLDVGNMKVQTGLEAGGEKANRKKTSTLDVHFQREEATPLLEFNHRGGWIVIH